jgi:hypothetical protein
LETYDGVGLEFEGPAECEIVVRQLNGKEFKVKFPRFSGSGVIQGIYNIDSSIESF